MPTCVYLVLRQGLMLCLLGWLNGLESVCRGRRVRCPVMGVLESRPWFLRFWEVGRLGIRRICTWMEGKCIVLYS